MQNTTQEVAGFKKKMKRSNDYNPKTEKLSIEQNKKKVVKQLKIPLKRGNEVIYNQMSQRIIKKKGQ